MREKPDDYLEARRVLSGPTRSTRFYGNNGQFIIWRRTRKLLVQASDGAGWEHVSVSVLNSKASPSWEDMCFIKNRFWKEDECVVQYHPPVEDYINNLDNCLHLWRPVDQEILRPPSSLVGLK